MSYYGRLLDAHLVSRGVVTLYRVPNHPHCSAERGWVTHRVVARVGFEEIGHVTISYIPRAVFDETLADRAEYCRIICGITNPTREDERQHKSQHRKFEQFHVDSVHIAYVGVDEAFQRRGIATRLYIEAAQWMGEQEGLMLAASDLQRPGPEGVWATLHADPDILTVRLADGRWAIDGRS